MQPGNHLDLLVVNHRWLIEKSLWTLTVPARALVLLRLYTLRLHNPYRAFFAYLVLSLLRTALLLPFSPQSKIYLDIYVFTQPAIWLFYILVVAELYSLVLKNYPGISSLWRWLFFAALGVAVVVSMLTVLPNGVGDPKTIPVLHYYLLISRGILTTLAVFLPLLMALAAGFCIPLTRNLLTHCFIFTAYFFTNNIAYFYYQLGGKRTAYIATLLVLGIESVCLFCWVFLLSSTGEKRTTSLNLGRSPAHEKMLLGKLASFNESLLRVARK